MKNLKKIKSIDGLKAISIMMIVLVHVAINGQYKIDNFFFNAIVKNLSVFVELFFILSAFGMCCGYYEKIKNKEIDLSSFYKKRIIKIWPYFALLIVLDLIASGFSKKNLIEAFLDGTLLTGFLPNNHIEIAGIGWFLGVVFAFYLLFPFFVFMTWTKIRAWISLALFIAIKILGQSYLNVDGKVVLGFFLNWFYLFIIGGLIYLYKEDLVKIFNKKEYILAILFALSFVGEVFVYQKGYTSVASNMVVLSFIILIIYCLVERAPIMGNKVFVFLGGLCLQIYLFHVVVFRAIDKIGLAHLVKNETGSLIITYILTLIVTIGVSYTIVKIFNLIKKYIFKKEKDATSEC